MINIHKVHKPSRTRSTIEETPFIFCNFIKKNLAKCYLVFRKPLEIFQKENYLWKLPQYFQKNLNSFQKSFRNSTKYGLITDTNERNTNVY